MQQTTKAVSRGRKSCLFIVDPLPDLLKLSMEERELYYLEGHLTC
jgi:hypothetical protein